MRLFPKALNSVAFSRPNQFQAGLVSYTPKALLAAILTLSFFATFVIDLPALAAIPAPAKTKVKQDPVLKGLPITDLSTDEAVEHALNRLAYGPRPGDMERIKQIGLAKWIDQQLNPKSIDDTAVEARLNDLPTLRMPTSQLLAEYPNPSKPLSRNRRRRTLNRIPLHVPETLPPP